jgi:S-methylmethionine-dependent homocysteine/selenocysteine methylase
LSNVFHHAQLAGSRAICNRKASRERQMAMDITLTGGGIETRIIYEFKRAIGNFEAYKLLADEAGCDVLRRIYESYVEVAVRYGLPIQLGTPTWRASRKWTKDVRTVNAAAVEFLRTIMRQFAGARIILAGVIGPASDGYATDEALSREAAFAYHRDQADVLAGLSVDLLYAPTFPAFSELFGVARALAQTGRPYALAPMLHPNGTMLDGTPLADAIARIDAEISPTPRHYMIGCLYPTHAETALQALRAARPDLVKRVRGLKANASPLPPEELDKLNHLATTDAQVWARDELTCAQEFNLTILGGCCGTDERYIDALARAVVGKAD